MKIVSLILSLALLLILQIDADAQTYLPVGPQTNVPVSTVTGGGWTECYRDTYDNGGTAMSATEVLAACPGSELLMACRLTGDSNLILLAQGSRTDVTFDTGDNSDVTHIANGTGWYFNTDRASWGFVRAGDSVAKNNCDVDTSGTNGERLCWHLNPGSSGAGGYRCGTADDLNDSNAYERIVYMEATATTSVPTLNEWGMMIFMALAGLGSVYYLRKYRKV